MTDFLAFTSILLQDVSAFLMSEPIVWFVGVLLLLAIARLVRAIISM